MPDANTYNNVLRNALKMLDNDIAGLTKQRNALAAMLGVAATKTTAPKRAKSATAKATAATPATGEPAKTRMRSGMLSKVLPWMEGQAEVTAAAMIDYLKTNGYPNAERKSLDASLSNTLKRPNSPVERVRPGVFRVTAAYFSRPRAQASSPVPQASAATATGANTAPVPELAGVGR